MCHLLHIHPVATLSQFKHIFLFRNKWNSSDRIIRHLWVFLCGTGITQEEAREEEGGEGKIKTLLLVLCLVTTRKSLPSCNRK